MSDPSDPHHALHAASASFATTRWSLIAAASADPSPGARAALATLCEVYWYPVYAFVRRRGYNADDSGDLTQEFFATLIEKDYLHAADSERGRFRSFLLTAVKRFLSRQRERATAKKRGGGRKHLPLDLESGEARYSLEPHHELTPERIFERRWALTLLDRVLALLQDEYQARGKQGLLEKLRPCLTSPADEPQYAGVAAELGMTEGAVKVAVHRMRQRYRELLRQEIAGTVADPADAEDELRHLLSAVRGEASETM